MVRRGWRVVVRVSISVERSVRRGWRSGVSSIFGWCGRSCCDGGGGGVSVVCEFATGGLRKIELGPLSRCRAPPCQCQS